MASRSYAAAGLLALTLISGLAIALPVASAATTVNIQMVNGANAGPTAQYPLGFSPANVTVVVGVNNTVTWTNNDAVDHTVYFKSQPAGSHLSNSSLISAGSTYTLTFTTPGVYYFYCTLHPYMQGTVKVLASTSPVPEFPASYLALTLFAVVAGVTVLVPRLRPSAAGSDAVHSQAG